MRAYKFRLYPSKEQEKQMLSYLWLAKNLWNELLEHCKRTYDDFGYFPTKSTLQLMVKNYGLFSQTQQEVAHRLHASLMKVFMMRKRGERCGFPRFKSLDRMKSLHYPQNGVGFHLCEKLRINPFGEIQIKKHREIKGSIKTLTLKREASGKWFAIFTAEEQRKQPKENSGENVGIDLGLMNFATLSNGKVLKNPRHFRKHEKKLAFLQRSLSKCRKRSRNSKKAKLRVARRHEKIGNCRSDFLHKLSRALTDSYSFIALEKLEPQRMAAKRYGKSINDAGWNMFANMLAYKAEEAGCRVMFVDAKDTSKTCSQCGEVVEKELQERIHMCPACNLAIDRDLNAARNILKRATAGTAESYASGDGTTVPSVKEDASRTTACCRPLAGAPVKGFDGW